MPPDEPELSDLEAALARLQPSPAGLDRDRLLFESGRAAGRGRRLWPAATGVMTAIAASLAAILLLRADPAPVVRVVTVERPVPIEPPALLPAPLPPEPAPSPGAAPADSVAGPAAASEFGRLQEFVTRFGIEDLPEPMVPDALPRTGATPAVSSAWQSHSRPAPSWLSEGGE